jgi:hypothetical protein
MRPNSDSIIPTEKELSRVFDNIPDDWRWEVYERDYKHLHLQAMNVLSDQVIIMELARLKLPLTASAIQSALADSRHFGTAIARNSQYPFNSPFGSNLVVPPSIISSMDEHR